MIRNINPDTSDAKALADIYNYYIQNTIVSFEEEPIDANEMLRRIGKVVPHYPWIVYENEQQILGYAYASEWNERVAYRNTVESTIYLHPDARGKGIGTQLYTHLIDILRKAGYHTVIGGISLPNAGSQALHEKMGYEKVAHYHSVGFKMGEWVDVGYWQLML